MVAAQFPSLARTDEMAEEVDANIKGDTEGESVSSHGSILEFDLHLYESFRDAAAVARRTRLEIGADVYASSEDDLDKENAPAQEYYVNNMMMRDPDSESEEEGQSGRGQRRTPPRRGGMPRGMENGKG